MSKITAQAPSLTPSVEDAVMKNPPRLPSVRTGPFRQIVAVFASLRLTVTLFTFGLLLVFFGTLAQMDEGLWSVLRHYFRTFGIAWIPNQTLVRFGQVFFGVSKEAVLPGSFPLPGGFIIGCLMVLNLTAAYTTRFRYTWKRAGILMLHAGVIVLMLGELNAHLFTEENRMIIRANSSSNFLENHERVEIAVISRADPKEDDVVVIPGSMLRKGETIQDARLPFDVEVKQFMLNSSDPAPAKDGAENPATAGFGKLFAVSSIPLTPGTDGEREDHPSAYVTFKEKGTGRPLGTYLLSTWVTVPYMLDLLPVLSRVLTDLNDRTQSVAVNDKPFEVVLRPQRTYKPYTLVLKEFRHDRYPGTDVAKNFSSLVRLVDPSRHEDREVKIYMNSPLRYEGETFYQSRFLPGDTGTILMVVANEGWLLPYIACTLVSLGMLAHFTILLVGFLKKTQGAAVQAEEKQGFLRSPAERYLPWAAFGLGAVYVAMTAMQPSHAAKEQMKLDEFAQLPVQSQGRIKPMEAIAREALLAVSNRQEEYRDKDGNTRPAIQWLLNVVTRKGNDDPVFRIENDEVLTLLGLPARPGSYRYSVTEVIPKINSIAEQAERAGNIDPAERTVFDIKILELAKRLQVYVDLARLKGLAVVPPRDGGDEWQTLAQAFHHKEEHADPAAESFFSMITAHAAGNARDFNAALDSYRSDVQTAEPVAMSKARFETFYNHFEPFMDCMVLYALAFFVTCAGWFGQANGAGQWSRTLQRTAYGIIILGLMVHTFGIGARMWIMDRPPITNLYSTAVFVGWGAVVLGLILEQWFPMGIGNAVASSLGFITAIIAHHLAHGDTMEVLQPVLDTNFWLATHVTCINAGYAATIFAGFLGMGYITAAWATRWLDLESGVFKALSQMIYGVVCFAMFLSFTGTVLGGIWADQSWGRFWGWDPKENGALLIVLVNAIVLHSRWGGLVKQRGIAVLTIVGNMVTAWSWFGTNQLGVGLHAYGFNKTLATCLVWFWAIELAFIGLGLLLPYARLNYPGANKTANA